MLNYFHEHQAIPEVSVICSQLDTLKHRIMSGNYENPRKEYDECKDIFDAVKQQTIFYKGIMPSEKVLDFPVDCNTLTGSVNL